MLNNDRLSDVKFVVRKIDGETESESKRAMSSLLLQKAKVSK